MITILFPTEDACEKKSIKQKFCSIILERDLKLIERISSFRHLRISMQLYRDRYYFDFELLLLYLLYITLYTLKSDCN